MFGQSMSPLVPRPKVLLADDHEMVLERVSALLTNFQVIGTVKNGKDLVSESLRLKPDVIVSDISMPVLNGIDAAHELREAGSTAVCILNRSRRTGISSCVPCGRSTGLYHQVAFEDGSDSSCA
jgi:DNA-binding NarL/FixJ family response regulator